VENPTSPPRSDTPGVDDLRSGSHSATTGSADASRQWLPPLAPGDAEPDRAETRDEPPLSAYDADIFDPVEAALGQVRPEPTRRGGFWGLVAAAAIGAGFAILALALTGALNTEGTPAASPPEFTQREIITLSGDGTSPAAVGQKVTPSIVTVEVGGIQNGDFAAFGSGSGVVLSADGLIATNHHVVENSNAAQVVFQDGSIHRATLVGSDPITDLAVLRIEAGGLLPIELGATSGLAIGDSAIAIGNPLGQRGGASLTLGVVSAFNRDVDVNGGDRLFGMIQTDAPITQGSSGGALVDNNGRLIGITTAIGVSSAGAEGIGYAIPVELMTRITDEIIATGTVRHPFLGVRLEDSFADTAGVLTPNGTLVTDFVEGSDAAADAGVEIGDIIVGFEDFRVRTLDDLVNGIRLYRVGDVVTLDLLRGDTAVSVEVTLGERPDGL
jgi:S1-C subfamily serine protease